MNDKIHWKMMATAFMLVVLAAAFWSTPAFAEGEPPLPEQPAAELAPDEAATPTEEAPPAEPPAPEQPAAPEGQLPAVAEQSPDQESAAPQELDFQQQPVDEPKPLEGIYQSSLSDPYFNCTDDTIDLVEDGVCNYINPVTGLQDAIADFATRGGYGYINVQDGLLYTATADITINAVPKLTGIRGTGSSLVTWTFDPTYRLAIENIASSFLLSGIKITGNVNDELVHFSGNGGTLTISDVVVENVGGDGLKVEDHTGAITLKEVKTNNNGGVGASLDNTAGSSSITVEESVFSGNGQTGNAVGLKIITDGKATLNGVSASNNKGDGIHILAGKGVSVTNAVMKDNVESPPDPDEFGYGLYIDPDTLGAISLTGILAEGNDLDGVRLGSNGEVTLKNIVANSNRNGLVICDSGCTLSGATTVTLNGVNEFSTNDWSGAVVRASGAVSINNTRFIGNLAPAAGQDYALFVQTPGATRLVSIVSDGNNEGVQLGVIANPTGSVTLLDTYGINQFNNSTSGSGLVVVSTGSVSLKGVVATGNALDGIKINNDEPGKSGSVILTSVTAADNDEDGIDVESHGVITLSTVIANGNWDRGAHLQNDGAAGSPAVSVTGSRFDFNTGGVEPDGLRIFTKGAVTLINSHASDNGENGVYLWNLVDTVPSNVTVRCPISEPCQFSGNDANGLFLYANGKVTLSNLALNENGVNGGWIDNVGNFLGYPLALSNLNAHNNGQRGFLFSTSGAITITNINTNGNGFFGVDITADQGIGAVIIKRTVAGWNTFNDNGTQDGLHIEALNTINIQKIQANGNGRYGADLDNCRQAVPNGPCIGRGSVTVSGTGANPNQFNRNGVLGLNAVSRVSITITNIHADENGFSGAEIVNYYSNATGDVTITAASGFTNTFDRNQGIRQQDEVDPARYIAEWGHGLAVFTNGAVSLRNLTANENHGAGVYVTNYGETPRYKSVDIQYGEFNNNTNGDGLYVTSLAPVNVRYVNASGNDGQDLAIPVGFDGLGGGAPAVVSERINNRSTDPETDLWNFRIGAGLTPNMFIEVKASLSVTITLEKYDTGSNAWSTVATESGSAIEMDFDSIEYAVQSEGLYRVIVAESTNSDVDYTLLIKEQKTYTAPAPATLTNPGRTGASGVDLNTFFDEINGNVTLYGTLPYGGAFDNNSASGILILAFGTINTRDVSANNNGLFGARLENYFAGRTVTLSGNANSFDGNTGSGLYIVSARNVSLSNIAANNNGSADFNLGVYRRYGIEVQTFATGPTIQLKTTRSTFRNSVSNNYFGLGFYTTGSATIQNTDVNSNGSSGAFIKYSSGTPLLGNFSITGSNFFNNSAYGLDVLTGSTITVDRMNAGGNATYGAQFTNTGTNRSVSIKRGMFEGNGDGDDFGLKVNVLGTILVDSVQANGNQGDGVVLDNQKVGQNGSVTLKASYWTNRFLDNSGGAGLEILSNGAVSLTGLEASRNSTDGLNIITTSTIYVKDAVLYANTLDGINASAGGNITILTIFSQGNTGDGAQLTSDAGTIKVSTAGFIGNGAYGLWLDIPTIANYSLSGVTYAGNGTLDERIDVTP